MPANTEPLHEASDRHNYYYRRPLNSEDFLPALVVGVGVGLAAFYVARLFRQRTLLIEEGSPAQVVRRRPRSAGEAG